MNSCKKIFALLLSLALLMACFVSCGENDNVGNVEPSGTTTANPSGVEEPSEVWFDMVDAEGNVCYIVYANGSSENVIDLANKTASRLKTLLGQKLPTVISEAEMSSNPGNYICIGNVNCFETATLLGDLKYSDNGFRVASSNVICVAAHSEDMLEESTKAFWNTFSRGIVDTKTLSDGTTQSGGRYYAASNGKIIEGKYNISALTIDGVDVSKYEIVYATDAEKDAALTIKDAIGKACGAVLNVKSAAYAETANEILIGATGREASKKYENTASHNYQIAIESGKLVFVSPNEILMDIGVSYISETLFAADGEAKTLALTTENNVLGTTTQESFDLVAKDEGDIRILSNNVYFEDHTRERAETFLKTIPLYNADIICLQEMDPSWHLLIDKGIAELGYTVVPTKGAGEYASATDGSNYTPIHYNADKVKLIDYGYQPYSSVKDTKESIFTKYPELASMNADQKAKVLKEYIKDGKEYGCVAHLSKSFTWALFESKTTGDRFIVISTHMTHDNSSTVANIRRQYDAKEVLAKIEALQAQYDVPVMVLGDFNFNSNEAPYRILTQGGLTNAARSADLKEVCGTTHTMGAMPNLNGFPIDMCFHTDGIDSNKLQIVVNEYTISYSDHIPVAFDFQVK